MKLALGTAQFGMDYGVSNSSGKVPLKTIENILLKASRSEIRVIDTASLYGDSEKNLGHFSKLLDQFEIISKFSGKGSIGIELNNSLSLLRKEYLYGYLFHRFEDFKKEEMIEDMFEFKAKGLIKKIGVSVYSPSEVEEVLKYESVDIVQVPVNIFDQRLVRSGLLKKLKERGVEIHARSIFLQGLPFAPDKSNDKKFKEFSQKLQTLKERKGTLVENMISFVRDLQEVDHMIMGFESDAQLSEVINAYNCADAIKESELFSILDELIINPSNW